MAAFVSIRSKLMVNTMLLIAVSFLILLSVIIASNVITVRKNMDKSRLQIRNALIAKGKLLAKYEESLPPNKLLNILKTHDTPANRIGAPKEYNLSPAQATQVSNTVSTTKISRPALKPIIKETKTSDTPSLLVSNPKKEVVSRVSPPKTAEGEGLFRFKVTHQPSTGYSVQIGAYREYGNVLKETAKLQQLFEI